MLSAEQAHFQAGRKLLPFLALVVRPLLVDLSARRFASLRLLSFRLVPSSAGCRLLRAARRRRRRAVPRSARSLPLCIRQRRSSASPWSPAAVCQRRLQDTGSTPERSAPPWRVRLARCRRTRHTRPALPSAPPPAAWHQCLTVAPTQMRSSPGCTRPKAISSAAPSCRYTVRSPPRPAQASPAAPRPERALTWAPPQAPALCARRR